MADSFSSRIRNIEARINQAKSAGLRSASSITTTTKSVIIPVQIVPYEVNYQWDNTASKYSARIHVSWSNSVGLCAAYIKSPANLANRRYCLDRITTSDKDCEFGFNVISGSNSDLDTYNQGGTIAPYNVEVVVVATSDFTLTYTLRQEH